MFNEQNVVTRIIDAACALDYPRGRLSIQVLDDSTDITMELSQAAVERHRSAGVAITLITRTDRVGFKAGALEEGLQHTDAEIVAIFDADFLPNADFLLQTVPHMEDGVGMVQASWGHLNARLDWLTRAQSVLLDGHFAVEHQARAGNGRWFNFNGTAGIWRRETIREAGGWQHDTLTEDMDLSYRAQLAGWRFVYVDAVVAPAELPRTMMAFKAQQHRWAKGAMQVARKLLWRIWRSDTALENKLEATAHLSANLAYPGLVILSLLMPWSVAERARIDFTSIWLKADLILFILAVVPFLLFYGAALWTRGERRRFLWMPVALATGIGMSVSQSKGVFDGLFGDVGEFVRTPKWGADAGTTYRSPRLSLVWLEGLLAAYLSAGMAWAVWNGIFAPLPFLSLFAGGYGYVFFRSIQEERAARPAAGTHVKGASHHASVHPPGSSRLASTR
jgi:cellulose synthase/poly-beta-1,6-N-acetylglucosamine synthase-like glycosyltransferase